MQALVLTIHILACIILIVLVLLQSGKEDMGVIFGGGSSSVFGSSGAGGILVKITAGAACIFLITSLVYNNLSGTKFIDEDSVMLKGDGVFTPLPEEEQKPKGIQFEKPAAPEKGAETSDASKASEPAAATDNAAEPAEKAAAATTEKTAPAPAENAAEPAEKKE